MSKNPDLGKNQKILIWAIYRGRRHGRRRLNPPRCVNSHSNAGVSRTTGADTRAVAPLHGLLHTYGAQDPVKNRKVT